MAKEYIEERDGGFYVAGARVSLDSIVHAFRRGESPETIRQNFNTLSLEEIYGAVAYYLANKSMVDAYLAKRHRKWKDGRSRRFLRLAGSVDGPSDLSSRKGFSRLD